MKTAQHTPGTWVAEVYIAYAYADKRVGDIISRHKSYDAANKIASKSSMLGVRYVSIAKAIGE